MSLSDFVDVVNVIEIDFMFYLHNFNLCFFNHVLDS